MVTRFLAGEAYGRVTAGGSVVTGLIETDFFSFLGQCAETIQFDIGTSFGGS